MTDFPTRRDAPLALRGGRAAARAGRDPGGALLEKTARLLFEHSLFNGHPRFFGYITVVAGARSASSPTSSPSAVNPNVGAWTLSPAGHARSRRRPSAGSPS